MSYRVAWSVRDLGDGEGTYLDLLAADGTLLATNRVPEELVAVYRARAVEDGS